jgi:DNA-directed RNA polymerase specialized sigma subunit
MKPRRLKKLEDEIWRVLPESNNRYFVSNYGRVKSFAVDKIDGQILKFCESNGFSQVQFNIDKYKRKFYVHKVVAELWLPKPSVKHTYVTHLDGRFKNNHISNLQWHTKESLKEKHRENKENRKDNPRHSYTPTNSKLKESDIVLLKSMLLRGVVQSKIAKLFRISEMQVTRIKRGENWGYVKAPEIKEE